MFKLNKDAFESICAFLNRRGGHLLLGVSNSGEVEGDVFKTMIPIPILDESGPGKSPPSPIMAKRLEGMEGEIIDEVRRRVRKKFGENISNDTEQPDHIR